MKNRKLLTAVGLAAALALTACGGNSEASDGLGERDGSDPVTALGGEEAAAEFESMYAAAVEDGQTTINVYTPLTATWPDVFAAFEERFPEISVAPLQIVGAELDTKVTQEQASGQTIADAVITGDAGAVNLADKDLFEQYQPFNTEELSEDPQFSLDTGTLSVVSASPRGFVYDTRQDEMVPESWEDLLDPSLKGKIVMDEPATDGGGIQLGDLLLHDDELGRDYLEKLAAQDPTISSNTAECHNMVVQGRAYVCLMGAMGNYLTLSGEGAPVEIVYPIEGGNWATYWYAGIMDGAENADAAKLLFAWLNSPEANEVKAEAGHGPVTNAENVELAFDNPGEVDQLPRPDLRDVTGRQAESLPILDEIFN